jgi:hypothetical protein
MTLVTQPSHNEFSCASKSYGLLLVVHEPLIASFTSPSYHGIPQTFSLVLYNDVIGIRSFCVRRDEEWWTGKDVEGSWSLHNKGTVFIFVFWDGIRKAKKGSE